MPNARGDGGAVKPVTSDGNTRNDSNAVSRRTFRPKINDFCTETSRAIVMKSKGFTSLKIQLKIYELSTGVGCYRLMGRIVDRSKEFPKFRHFAENSCLVAEKPARMRFELVPDQSHFQS